jgi:transcriptional regulator with XRE-family HTH domain
MESLRKTVANNVKALRVRAGLSQSELARQAKLTDVYISRIEREAKNLTLDTVDQIARALSVPVAVLILTQHHKIPKATPGARKAIKHTIKILNAYLEIIEGGE